MASVTATPRFSGLHYRVVGTLGTGAGSTILQIADKNGGKRYALKVVRKQEPEDEIYIEQAKTEYDAAQKLNHRTIAKIYDIRVKKAWFVKTVGVELLMELVDGKTLDEIEAPELNQLVLMFAQVASGLAHMHRRGVYHGDLKPSNIMLTKTGQVKLIDFGTAWVRGVEKNRVQGTPQYIAPEQAAERIVNERTDVYNFGATMYRMFTGRYVQNDIPRAGVERKIVPVNQINPRILSRLNKLILDCLSLNPEKRPAGMSEVRDTLSAVIKEMGLEDEELRGAEDDE
ncbi:serine/threonine protein kinase [Paludisphaera rhizosphaerae]|uniref:serine/threonine protein kinase n=1 Tax=Paludisphaera rhizosphaerae TaxID=2711216 RepID=UPI0013ED204B|nr:serine/threonine-protein kinase [Paludisphaera rhizosphaerae]